jgi:hypothetical protein
MKNKLLPFFCSLFLLSATNLIQAQPQIIEHRFTITPDERIELNLKFGDQILIKAWDRPEVSFRATAEVNGGRLNDAVLFDFNQEGKIRIDMDFDREKIKEGRAEDCPGKNYSYYNRNKNGVGHIVCSEIAYEIYLPRNADLFVETISANIELLGLYGPVSVKSISGFVDMRWQEREGAELSMKTISGGVYSDLDNLEFHNKNKFFPVGQNIKAKAGAGGTTVRLESISGDIFLRKGN